MIKEVRTENAPKAIGPYSQAMTIDKFVFTSGQIPLDPSTGNMVGSDITAQTKQVCENLKAVLIASGSSLTSVIKTTCFLRDIADFSAFNEVYSQYFTGKPARSCVAVRELPKGALVEVEAIAVKEN